MARLPVTDGMRALAVIAVVLFHSFPALVPGGFVGVDVFFVISGFIISLVYQDGLVARSTSFVTFYVRRVRRLAPAYIAVVLLTTVACFIILLPRDLSNYAFSLALQAVYLQNIAFWMIGDYFESALAKPLLHTWSLAVEEQFYLAFPLLVLIARRGRGAALVATAAMIASSLAIGWAVGGISPKTAFYWLPTRAWEFGAGILAASSYRHTPISGRIGAALAGAGLVLILLSFAAFDGASLFPGPQSLTAVTGSVLLLISQDTATLATGVLRMRWAQGIGRISYSWYLWHWPPLSLWFLATGAVPAGWTAVLLTVVGLIAGATSYLFIERRIARGDRILRPRSALAIICGFAIVALGASSIVFRTDGFVRSYSPQAEALLRAQLDVPPYRCPLLRRLAMWREPVCELNDVAKNGGVVLIGDSHADRTKTVLVRLADQANVPLYLTKQNCRLSDYGVRFDCTAAGLRTLATSLHRLGVKRVVAIAHWDVSPSRIDNARLAANIATLDLPIFLQLPTPSAPAFDPASRLDAHASIQGGTAPTRASAISDSAGFRAFAYALAERRSGLIILDPLPTLCPLRCRTLDKGIYLYRDANHLTLEGVKLLVPLYEPIFARNALPPSRSVQQAQLP